MVGMKDQQHVERTGYYRVGGEILGRNREHHLQKVAGVLQVVVRVDVRLVDPVLVGPGDHRRRFGHQTPGADVDILLVERVEGIRVIRGQRRSG